MVLIWATALLVALGNALVVARRLPIQRRLAMDAEEQTAQQAASWLHHLPSNLRVVTVISSEDANGFWFRCRLTYLALPQRLDLLGKDDLASVLPHTDGLLLYGVSQNRTPVGWHVVERASNALLAVPPSYAWPHQLSADPAETPTRFPVALRTLNAVWSMVAIVLLGALTLGTTLRSSPFRFWWANLALAHLTGATLIGWLGTLEIGLPGRLAVYPIYALLLLSLPAMKRARQIVLPSVPNVPRADNSADWRRPTTQEWLLAGLIVLGIMTALERGLLIGVEWDGFMIWQMKARAFFYDGAGLLLRQPAHFPEAYLDYPLLVPLNSWWTMAHFGAAADGWGRANGFLFYGDVLVLFAGLAWPIVGRMGTLMGLALLASAPFVTEHAVSGYADLALAAYMLALGGCLLKWRANQDAPRLAAWMLAGMVLTKNEGLLGCLSFLAVVGVMGLIGGRWRAEGKNLGLCAVAATLAYLPWLWVKQRWHLANDVIQASQRHAMTSLFLWQRLWQTLLQGFARHALLVGPWMPAWGLLLMLIPVGFVVFLRRHVTLARPLWLLGGLQLLGYTGIYLITPYDLHNHIESSIDRLILHVLPILFLAALMACFVREAPSPSGDERGGDHVGEETPLSQDA